MKLPGLISRAKVDELTEKMVAEMAQAVETMKQDYFARIDEAVAAGDMDAAAGEEAKAAVSKQLDDTLRNATQYLTAESERALSQPPENN